MTENLAKCVYCERDSYEVPLVAMRYQDKEAWICPQHLPIVIHKPQLLAGKLPGVENLVSEGH
ncbi:MAG TPA: hypothetical protein DEH22_18100 [Chloroflexi bacterium]|nr:hypothetical protein [Chloroflexota bacterium]